MCREPDVSLLSSGRWIVNAVFRRGMDSKQSVALYDGPSHLLWYTGICRTCVARQILRR